VSGEVDLPAGVGDAEEEAASAGVSGALATAATIKVITFARILTRCSFMADKIMPLSDALEGYELFNGMKVQKVVFEAQK
jgi:hypothetical protein